MVESPTIPDEANGTSTEDKYCYDVSEIQNDTERVVSLFIQRLYHFSTRIYTFRNTVELSIGRRTYKVMF